MTRHLAFLLCLGALAAPARAQDELPGFAASYLCRGGAVLQVAYINPESGPSLAVVGWAGKLVPMQQHSAASAVRYIAFDEQESFRWYSKGDEGMLAFLAADDHAQEETVLDDCRRLGR